MKDTVVAIVDDDEAVRGSLQLLLQSLGWQAQAFDSAERFLAGLPAAGAPDCLLLDLNMPGMNGADLLDRLAVSQPTLPVIVISGRTDSPLAMRARKSGAEDVLDKPFQEQTLKDAIERSLASGAVRKARAVAGTRSGAPA